MSRALIEHGLNWRWTPAKVRRTIRDRDTMVLVADVRGRIAGFAIMKFRNVDSHLYLLAVTPDRQRRGIGRAMLAWLEKSCRTAGIQRIRVEVRSNNMGARRFYEGSGFRLVGRIAGYYERRESATVMVKSLTHTQSALDR